MLVPKIDIHVHTSESGWPARLPVSSLATPEEIIAMYDEIGVEKGVLLPLIKLETGFHTSSNYENWLVTQKYPERFAWFCNLDPRQEKNSPESDFTPYLEFCKEKGAKGVGEIAANIPFDDPLTINLFRQCAVFRMPVIFHIGDRGNDYGLIDGIGLPGLEHALQLCPETKFLGHSQKFWAEISGEVSQTGRNGYPEGKVQPGGRVVELLRRYPNLCADLSARSGYNAVTRDPAFGYAFLEEFQDRLFYGTDIAAPEARVNPMLKLSAFLDEAVSGGKISQTAYEKISRGNAIKLLQA